MFFQWNEIIFLDSVIFIFAFKSKLLQARIQKCSPFSATIIIIYKRFVIKDNELIKHLIFIENFFRGALNYSMFVYYFYFQFFTTKNNLARHQIHCLWIFKHF